MSDEEDESYIPSNSEDETHNEYDDDDEQTQSDGSFEELVKEYSSNEENAENLEEYEDCNHLFQTDHEFRTRDDALQGIRDVGMDYNMYFSIGTTREGKRTYFRCHRPREYRPTVRKEGAKARKSSGSVMIRCPFQIVVEMSSWTCCWVIRTMTKHGKHNHSLGERKEGYRWPSALKKDEIELVRHRSDLGVKPTKILEELKKAPRENYSNLRHIYNERHKQKKEAQGELPPFQFLFMMLSENGWYHTSRRIPGTNLFGDLFFADRRCISLGRQFNQVVLIDATYKTNRWNLPLVEIIGVVPTGQNYHLAFALIHNEKEDSYTWVMEKMVEIMIDHHPSIFVTDRELASMNAIASVFPDATNLLCRRHISVDVQKYLTRLVKSKDKDKSLTCCWKAIVNAQTTESYEWAVKDLRTRFHAYPKFIDYVFDTWLDKHREKFVAYWVDKHLHYESVTTNKFKSFLEKGWKKATSAKGKEKCDDDNIKSPVHKSNQNSRSKGMKDVLIEVPLHIRQAMPREIQEFLVGYSDVLGDGHCGYRAISWWFWKGDQSMYVSIRSLLTHELEDNSEFWWQYYGDEYPTIVERINYFANCALEPHYWMGAFLMLPLVATHFKKIICFYLRVGSTTYLPLRYEYNDEDSESSIVPPLPEIWHIGHSGSHFFVVDVAENAPKPRRHALWKRNCATPNIKPWDKMLGCATEWWKS